MERIHLLARTTISVLATTFVTALVLTMISAAQTPLGWALTVLAAIVGLVLPTIWYRLAANGADEQLAIWQLAPQWAKPVANAAAQAERLQQLADRSPEGPVADHFDRLAQTAQGYVVALHQAAVAADAATGGAPNARDPELEEDMQLIVAELAELVDAAERLRRAQRQHLETSPLVELTAETDRITAAIESEASGGSPLPEDALAPRLR